MVIKSHPFLFFLFLLFLLTGRLDAFSKPLLLSPDLMEIKQAIFNFEHTKARTLLKTQFESNSDLPVCTYLEDLNDCIELFTASDQLKFEAYQPRQKERIELLKKLENKSQNKDFKNLCDLFRAEIYYHWAILKIYYQEEGKGIVDFKRSYDLITSKKLERTQWSSDQKLNGTYAILLDQVPDKYTWVTELLGFHGDAQIGFKHINEYLNSSPNDLFWEEAKLTRDLLQLKFQEDSIIDPTIRLKNIKGLSEFERYGRVYMLMKQKQTEAALNLIQQSKFKNNLPAYLYFQGDIALKKGRNNSAIIFYLQFLNSVKSERNVKSAYLMLYYAHFLAGDELKANTYLKKILSVGNSVSTKDRYANSFAELNKRPNKYLLQARLQFDGGYFKKSLNTLNLIPTKSSANKPALIAQITYRKARNHHELGNLDQAIDFYLKTIQTQNLIADKESVFLLAKSSLELGEIYFKQQKQVLAKKYLEKAIAYKKHYYEEEIEQESISLLKKIK